MIKTSGNHTYELEKFLPNSFRVRLIVDDMKIFVGILSKKSIDKEGRVRGDHSYADENARRSSYWKWVGSNIDVRVCTWSDSYTIDQALAAVRQNWIDKVVEL